MTNKEPWVIGVTEPMECERCKRTVRYKVVPIWGKWYHVICPICGHTGWLEIQREVEE